MSRITDILGLTREPVDIPSIIDAPANGYNGRELVASAHVIPAGDRGEANRLHKLKGQQPWQPDAWTYRDAIGEIRFAMGFLGHALSRMRVFPASSLDPEAEPVPIGDADGLPAGLAAAAVDAVERLGGGTASGVAKLLAVLGENFEVPGEGYLLGRTVAGGEEWSIRSTDELVSKDGNYALAATPGARGNDLEPVGPDAFIARLWTPHPRYSRLADSPMRSLVLGGVCEELLLTSRMIRRASKSRLAGNGILIIDNTLEFPSPEVAEGDEQREPDFSVELTRAMIEPIANESAASGMVPIVVSADLSEGRRAMEHVKLFSDVDSSLLDRQDKALGRIAMTLDVPPEVILGMADVNHWTAWQVDDSTFRHHIEPLVIRVVDALTEGYLRPMLEAAGFTAEQAAMVVIWYDPTELVTNPNRKDDAKAGHDAMVLSDEVYVTALGYDPEQDMPDDDERIRRIAQDRGSVDPPLTEAMLKEAMQGLAIEVARAKTQADPGAPVQPIPTPPPPGEGEPAPIPSPEVSPPPSTTGSAGSPFSDENLRRHLNAFLEADAAVRRADPVLAVFGDAIRAANDPQGVDNPVGDGPVLRAHVKASERLNRLERSLRDRLAAAADAAMRRAMERAGNRVKTQANRYAGTRAVVASVGPRQAYAALTDELRASLGLDPAELLDGAWSDLQAQWNQWTEAAREEAVNLALGMAGVNVDDPDVQARLATLTRGYAAAGDDAWAFLVNGLDRMATAALADPDAVPDPASPEPVDFPMTGAGVLLSLVRGALSVLGGLPAHAAGITRDGTTADGAERLGGLTGGELLEGFMRDAGVEVIAYEWVYGISVRHFEPHRALDGATFARFGDPILDNPLESQWPFPTLAPGDHRGCHCDAMPIYGDGLNAADAARQLGDASYDDSYLEVLRTIALDDIAAGRLDTSPIQTLIEAERVANSRPNQARQPTPITDAVRGAGGRVSATSAPRPGGVTLPDDIVPDGDGAAAGRYLLRSDLRRSTDRITQLVLNAKTNRDRDDEIADAIVDAHRAAGFTAPDVVISPPPDPGKPDRFADVRRMVADKLGAASGDPDMFRERTDIPGYRGMTVSERRAATDALGAERFEVLDPSALTGRTVLVVDDVITSGEQVKSLRRSALDAGAEHVNVVALAWASSSPEDRPVGGTVGAPPYAELLAHVDTLTMDELDELAGMYPQVFADPDVGERFAARMDFLDQAERDARTPPPQSVADWYAEQMARDAEVIAIRKDALPPKVVLSTHDRWHLAKREEYQNYLERMLLEASEATSGQLVNPAVRLEQARGGAHSDEWLWSGPASSVIRAASDELIRWWQDDPGRRMTWTEFRDGVRGDKSSFRQALKNAEDIRSGKSLATRRPRRALSAGDKLAQDQRRIARARKAEADLIARTGRETIPDPEAGQ